MAKGVILPNKLPTILAWIFVLPALYLASLHSFLLFHILVEIFSIVVACGIFMVAWNSRRFLENSYLLFLGIAYLFIALLDQAHTLAYSGMGVFPGYGNNLAAQLWIASRYMEGLSLFLAPMFFGRQVRTKVVFLTYSLVFSVVLLSIFGEIFPTCFVEGEGLTPFKIINEYVICLILLGAAIQLYRKRDEFEKDILALLVAAVFATIASELTLTLYIHAYGFSNLIGHYLKLISFYLIYKALIETGLTRPYDLMFRNLKKSKESLQESEAKFRGYIDNAPDGVLVVDKTGKYLEANNAICSITGYSKKEILSISIPDTLAPESKEAGAEHFNQVINWGHANGESDTSGQTGGLKNVNRSKRFKNHGPPQRWRALSPQIQLIYSSILLFLLPDVFADCLLISTDC